jgi:hypothetical protein
MIYDDPQTISDLHGQHYDKDGKKKHTRYGVLCSYIGYSLVFRTEYVQSAVYAHCVVYNVCIQNGGHTVVVLVSRQGSVYCTLYSCDRI